MKFPYILITSGIKNKGGNEDHGIKFKSDDFKSSNLADKIYTALRYLDTYIPTDYDSSLILVPVPGTGMILFGYHFPAKDHVNRPTVRFVISEIPKETLLNHIVNFNTAKKIFKDIVRQAEKKISGLNQSIDFSIFLESRKDLPLPDSVAAEIKNILTENTGFFLGKAGKSLNELIEFIVNRLPDICLNHSMTQVTANPDMDGIPGLLISGLIDKAHEGKGRDAAVILDKVKKIIKDEETRLKEEKVQKEMKRKESESRLKSEQEKKGIVRKDTEVVSEKKKDKAGQPDNNMLDSLKKCSSQESHNSNKKLFFSKIFYTLLIFILGFIAGIITNVFLYNSNDKQINNDEPQIKPEQPSNPLYRDSQSDTIKKNNHIDNTIDNAVNRNKKENNIDTPPIKTSIPINKANELLREIQRFNDIKSYLNNDLRLELEAVEDPGISECIKAYIKISKELSADTIDTKQLKKRLPEIPVDFIKRFTPERLNRNKSLKKIFELNNLLYRHDNNL